MAACSICWEYGHPEEAHMEILTPHEAYELGIKTERARCFRLANNEKNRWRFPGNPHWGQPWRSSKSIALKILSGEKPVKDKKKLWNREI